MYKIPVSFPKTTNSRKFLSKKWDYSGDSRVIDHRPTFGRQFVMSVVGRSTFRHLEFSELSAGIHRLTTEKSTEGRLVYRAILTNRLVNDRPYTDYVKHLPSIGR